MSKKITDVFYFNGNKIPKQTYNKYLKWNKIINSILRESDRYYMLSEIYGNSVDSHLTRLKKDGYLVYVGRWNHGYYIVTDKGREFINNFKTKGETK